MYGKYGIVDCGEKTTNTITSIADKRKTDDISGYRFLKGVDRECPEQYTIVCTDSSCNGNLTYFGFYIRVKTDKCKHCG